MERKDEQTEVICEVKTQIPIPDVFFSFQFQHVTNSHEAHFFNHCFSLLCAQNNNYIQGGKNAQYTQILQMMNSLVRASVGKVNLR